MSQEQEIHIWKTINLQAESSSSNSFVCIVESSAQLLFSHLILSTINKQKENNPDFIPESHQQPQNNRKTHNSHHFMFSFDTSVFSK